MAKLSQLKRKVAGTQMSTCALNMSTDFNLMLRPILDKREFMQGWGPDVLTPAERVYFEKLLTRLHNDSQLLLKFSWRFK